MDTERTVFSYVFETTPGVTPSNPVLKKMRTAGPDMGAETTTVRSQEITGDRQITDFINTGTRSGGSIPIEMSYGNADDWIEAILCGAWTAPVSAPVTAVITTQWTMLNVNAAKFKKGMIVRGSGFAQANNNGLKVLSADASGNGVQTTGLTAEASPPAGAELNLVGFECASGDCAASTAVVSGKTLARLTISATSGVWTDLGLTAGSWVFIGGTATGNQFATAACNGWARVAKGGIAATTLDFDIYPTGFTTDAGTSKSIRLSLGERLTNGVTRRSATVQQAQEDHSPISYERFQGVEGNTLTWDMSPGAPVRGGLELVGRDGDYYADSLAGASYVEAPTNRVMATTDDLGALRIDDVDYGDGTITRLQLSMSNQMAERRGLGKKGINSFRTGSFTLTGTIEAYFRDLHLAQRMTKNQDVQFHGLMTDGTRVIHWDIPAMKLAGRVRRPGPNSDAMVNATISARKSPDLGYTVRLTRFAEFV